METGKAASGGGQEGETGGHPSEVTVLVRTSFSLREGDPVVQREMVEVALSESMARELSS